MVGQVIEKGRCRRNNEGGQHAGKQKKAPKGATRRIPLAGKTSAGATWGLARQEKAPRQKINSVPPEELGRE